MAGNCHHVSIGETKEVVNKNNLLVRSWSCNGCGKTWEVKRPGKFYTWRWEPLEAGTTPGGYHTTQKQQGY